MVRFENPPAVSAETGYAQRGRNPVWSIKHMEVMGFQGSLTKEQGPAGPTKAINKSKQMEMCSYPLYTELEWSRCQRASP